MTGVQTCALPILFMQESEVTFTNSIIWGNRPQQIAFSEYGDPSLVNIFYSIIDEFVTGVETHNNGTVNFGLFDVFDDNPLFCGLESGNYYLAENSLCVNSGENGTYMGVYGIDRKSTRLNSSHALISYAVFCLKKKKII